MSNYGYLLNYDSSKNKKPSKRELYQQKLKEREIFNNNSNQFKINYNNDFQSKNQMLIQMQNLRNPYDLKYNH